MALIGAGSIGRLIFERDMQTQHAKQANSKACRLVDSEMEWYV